jgi:hypothetical protein
MTALYLTILFAALGEEFAYFFHDDRHWRTRAAGIGAFAKSKGGHLHDDVHAGRVGTISEMETYLLELCGFEQGLMLQNIALTAEAMGLGAFPHYGAHRFGWLKALGFQMKDRTFAEILHKGPFQTLVMRLLNKNVVIPQPMGLERDGRVLIKPYTTPYYPSMEAAVYAFVASKFEAGKGIFRDAPGASPYLDPGLVQGAIPEYSEANIKAVIAFCNYCIDNYGQFPATCAPTRTLMAFQVHHIDPAFYDRFYRPGAYTAKHVEHASRWHPEMPTVNGR